MIIKLEHVCKSFGEHEIFHDFSLDVEEGDFLLITGKSGSGKTTLLNLMGGLEPPNSGHLTICGIKDPKFHSKVFRLALKQDIGFLFQNYGLVENKTVLENMCLGMAENKKRERNRVQSFLEKMDIAYTVDQKVYQLSGGEQQRVALAKLFMKDPKIIFADEPTGSLDEENRDMVMNTVKTLNNQGKTIVLVSHDRELAKYASHQIDLR